MTIIDLEKKRRKNKTDEFKANMNNVLDFCKVALEVLSSPDIILMPKNDAGMDKLKNLVDTMKTFRGGLNK